MAIQCRKSFLSCALSLAFFLFAGFSLITAEESDQEDLISHPVFRWLKEEHGDDFYFNPKLILEGDSIYVQESLDESEVLMVIPSSAIISTIDQLEDELVEDIFCTLAARVWEELQLGNDSNFTPYVQYIKEKHASEPIIPNFWSTIGQRLIGLVYGNYLATDFLIDWIDDFENCREFLVLDDEDMGTKIFESYIGDHTTIWHSDNDNARRHVVAITAKRQIDQLLLVPLYDDLEHHLVEPNVKQIVRRDYSVAVVAKRHISPGETLYRPSQACLFECVEPRQHIVLDVVRNFGYVPPYPHYWEIPDLELSFVIHAGNETAEGNASQPTLSWIDKPYEQWQVKSLESRYRRSRDKYTEEVLRSVGTVPSHEWNVIEEYSSALQTALMLAVEYGKEEILQASRDGDEDVKDRHSIIQTKAREGECLIGDKVDGSVDVDPMEGVEMDEHMDDEKGRVTEWDPWSITHTSCSNCTLEELEKSRGCDKYAFTTMHNQSTWTHLRAAYVAVMGENSSINATYRSGLRVPFKIDHSPGRGRGIFAMDDVLKGTLVWSAQHTGVFTTGKQFRQFLSVLPDVLACDLCNWCYTSEDTETLEDESSDDENSKHVIACDLDEGKRWRVD